MNTPLPISPQDTQQLSRVRQLLECRAKLKDSEINNQLLHELVFKYSELEKKLQNLNRELTVKQERIEQDLSAAARIQRSLLPKRSDSLEGLDVAWKFKPCEKIGGDIFNLIQLDNEHWAIYIIDVNQVRFCAADPGSASMLENRTISAGTWPRCPRGCAARPPEPF